jgi:hypothetical protein
MSLEILDPTSEHEPISRQRSPRPASLEGRRIGLLDISKPRGDVFLDRLQELLNQRGATTVRFRKPTFARPAPRALLEEIFSGTDMVVEALAD